MKINILGIPYSLKEKNEKDDAELTGHDGYCDTSIKEMVVAEMKDYEPGKKKCLAYYQAQVKRHEIIHGFLFESGLDTCCGWACEEMVDWLSIQFPKIQKAFEEAGCQ